jgi:gluconate 2-dehydrogenase
LQHLAIWGTGTDNVDLAAAQAAGIVVTNTPNTATDAVADVVAFLQGQVHNWVV